MALAPEGQKQKTENKKERVQIMGIAKAVKEAPVRTDSEWLTEGNYDLLQVTGLKEIDKPGKLLFIAEMDILESDGDKAIRPGMDASYCVDCLKFEGTLAGDVAKFLAALMNVPIEDVDEEGITAAVSEAQPCIGLLIKARARLHTTANNRVITKTRFFPATKEDHDRSDALRESVGFSPLVPF